MAAGVSQHQMRGEPLTRQQIIHTQAEGKGTQGDRQQIKPQRLPSKHLTDDQDGSHVGGRPCHQQDECRTGRDAFEHQRDGNRDGTRGAHIHRDGDGQHHQHAQDGRAGKTQEEIVGHENRDQSRDDQAQHEPSADVLNHVHETIAQSLQTLLPKAEFRLVFSLLLYGFVRLIARGHSHHATTKQSRDKRRHRP